MADILIACHDVMDNDSIEKRNGDVLYVRKFSGMPTNLENYFSEQELKLFLFAEIDDPDLVDKMNRNDVKKASCPYVETMEEPSGDPDGSTRTIMVQRSRIRFDMSTLSEDELVNIKNKKHVYTKLHKRDTPVTVRSAE